MNILMFVIFDKNIFLDIFFRFRQCVKYHLARQTLKKVRVLRYLLIQEF